MGLARFRLACQGILFRPCWYITGPLTLPKRRLPSILSCKCWNVKILLKAKASNQPVKKLMWLNQPNRCFRPAPTAWTSASTSRRRCRTPSKPTTEKSGRSSRPPRTRWQSCGRSWRPSRGGSLSSSFSPTTGWTKVLALRTVIGSFLTKFKPREACWVFGSVAPRDLKELVS